MIVWHLGDWSASGIGLTVCYLALAVACFRIAFRHGGRFDQPTGSSAVRRTAIWSVLGATLLLVAIERQIGVFDLLTDMLRDQARVDGDYSLRRARQAEMLKLIAIAALIMGVVAIAAAGRAGRVAAWQAAVTIMIVTYLLMKAVSLHVIDRLIFHHVGGIALGNLIELGLVALSTPTVALAFFGAPQNRPNDSRVRLRRR